MSEALTLTPAEVRREVLEPMRRKLADGETLTHYDAIVLLNLCHQYIAALEQVHHLGRAIAEAAEDA
jgi:hypothetical protein